MSILTVTSNRPIVEDEMSLLKDLHNVQDGDPIYFYRIAGKGGDVYSKTGWFVYDEEFRDWLALDSLNSAQSRENLSGWDYLDEQRTLARRLLPGEELTVTFREPDPATEDFENQWDSFGGCTCKSTAKKFWLFAKATTGKTTLDKAYSLVKKAANELAGIYGGKPEEKE